jgi:type IV pilus assembly protein PilC
MSSYAFVARDDRGQQFTGTLSGANAADVSRQLRAEGKYPVRIDPANIATSRRDAGLKISRAELLGVSHQLAIMLETGVTLPDALDCIVEQATHPVTRELIEDVASQVKQGTDFSTAISRHPRSFPRLYVALVRAGEKSGSMPRMLARASAYLRDENDTRRRVKGALTYPAIMFGFACMVTLALMVFVLPRFTAIYATKRAALPTPTKILMSISEFLVGNWMFLVPGVLAVVVGVVFYVRSPSGREVWHSLQLRLPLLGSMFRQMHLARGLRMMGTMTGAGVTLVDSVEVTHDLSDNTRFRELWSRVSQQIQAGKQISEPLADSPLVPPSVAQMLRSGEKSGKLAMVMEQVASFSEQELKERIVEVTRYIEPAMIVLMGAIIGGVALALLLPIFTISKVMAS